jgi:4-alpha-glucanotransferase
LQIVQVLFQVRGYNVEMHDDLPPELRRLYLLARMHGVQRSYWSIFGERISASPEAILATLGALGAPLGGLDDVEASIAARRRDYWQQLCEPVHVSWDGHGGQIVLRIPESRLDRPLRCQVRDESGDTRTWEAFPRDLPVQREVNLDGTRTSARSLALPEDLSLGYHVLTVEIGDITAESLLIAAPSRIPSRQARQGGAEWGVFLPLYALHSERSMGIGDLTDLESLLRWVVELGGDTVGTLPLLPVYLDEPFQPSPYSSASRLFWNELYVDPTAAPELQQSSAARELLASAETRQHLQDLNQAREVSYREVAALRRRVLGALAESFFAAEAGQSDRHDQYRRFLEDHPLLEEYAAFRATMEVEGGTWPTWPAHRQRAALQPWGGNVKVAQAHAYGQWLAHEQLGRVAQTAESLGASLYLDLPIGVPYDSYDVWRNRELFAKASTGAPPDTFFIGGQDWGFPPLHPEALRQQGYRYLIDTLRHHLQFARRLRIDHIMGCSRLFWIPPDFDAPQGVYVRYRAAEIFAILCLEAHRHGAMIVGEDLGTVPNRVRQAIGRHGMRRMYTLQTELTDNYDSALPQPAQQSLASLNTHDMPPFAAFLQAADIEDLLDLGHLDADRAGHERYQRGVRVQALIHFLRSQGWLQGESTDAASLASACQSWLAASPASSVIVNLEDLWQETLPQNVPGTTTERRNWQRRARLSLEEMMSNAAVIEQLESVDEQRRNVRGRECEHGDTKE